MPLSRNALIAIILLLAVAIAGGLAAWVYDRNREGGVEIRFDRNGLRIEGR
jgi:hypothetical protein